MLHLYIATSLDGFIARTDGSVDWLFTDADYGYAEFYARISALIMGRTTYDQILSFGEYPYAGKPCYVLSSRDEPPDKPDPGIRFVDHRNLDPAAFAAELDARHGGDLWLLGGEETARPFLDNGVVDELILSVHPIILGQGISLYAGSKGTGVMELKEVIRFDSGLVQLRYDLT